MRSVSLRPRVGVAVAFCFVLTSSASAATVTAVTGKVSINRGDGFVQISNRTSVKPGDRSWWVSRAWLRSSTKMGVGKG